LIKIFYIKNQKGFSLIEMMVVVVILGLIVLGLVTFFTGGTKSWVAGQYQLAAQRNARQAMDRMVREIRKASDIIANSTTSKEINFNTPWDSNLNYSWSGKKWDPVFEDINSLINHVQILTFQYFDILDVEVALPLTPETAAKISKVHINLKVDVDKDNNPDITLNTEVKLRNFGVYEYTLN
jgi:prepilin-type N-terminal cleavage/methylation domain-containing protein